jgi:hypothetical protein
MVKRVWAATPLPQASQSIKRLFEDGEPTGVRPDHLEKIENIPITTRRNRP